MIKIQDLKFQNKRMEDWINRTKGWMDGWINEWSGIEG